MRSRISIRGCVRPSVRRSVCWSVRPSHTSWNPAKVRFSTKITGSTSENASYAVYTVLFQLSIQRLEIWGMAGRLILISKMVQGHCSSVYFFAQTTHLVCQLCTACFTHALLRSLICLLIHLISSSRSLMSQNQAVPNHSALFAYTTQLNHLLRFARTLQCALHSMYFLARSL